MRWWWGMSVISQTKLWWFVPIYQCPVSSTDKFSAGDSGYWERRAFTVEMSCRYWEWLIISVTRRTQRPVWDTGCRSHHWPPRTLWSSCSCSSSGATPSSSPTGPGTGSFTRTGTRDQICGGHFSILACKMMDFKFLFLLYRFLMDVIKSKTKDDEQTPSSSLNVLNQNDNSSFVDIDPNPPLCNARPAVV